MYTYLAACVIFHAMSFWYSGLSEVYHPLQILADLQTLQERFGQLRGLTVSWVGDGNNVLHSLMIGCGKLGMHVRAATPKGYEPIPEVIEKAKAFGKEV